jgi:hypothetical protein
MALAGMFFGLLTARAVIAAAIDGVESSNPVVVGIHVLSSIATFAVIIWAFTNLVWWIPAVGFVALSLLIGFIIVDNGKEIFYKFAPVTGLIAIAVTTYLWLGPTL